MQKKFEIVKHEQSYDGFFKLETYTLKHTLFAGGWSNVILNENYFAVITV